MPREGRARASKSLALACAHSRGRTLAAALPYSKIQAFSVEIPAHFSLDAELELRFSGLEKLRLAFKGAAGIVAIGRMTASTAP
jgi:hypothetical protein